MENSNLNKFVDRLKEQLHKAGYSDSIAGIIDSTMEDMAFEHETDVDVKKLYTPKFKIGDYVMFVNASDNNPHMITKMYLDDSDEMCYVLEYGASYKENKLRKWTLDDAKICDIIMALNLKNESDSYIFRFKYREYYGVPHVYEKVSILSGELSFNVGLILPNCIYRPASEGEKEYFNKVVQEHYNNHGDDLCEEEIDIKYGFVSENITCPKDSEDNDTEAPDTQELEEDVCGDCCPDTEYKDDDLDLSDIEELEYDEEVIESVEEMLVRKDEFQKGKWIVDAARPSDRFYIVDAIDGKNEWTSSYIIVRKDDAGIEFNIYENDFFRYRLFGYDDIVPGDILRTYDGTLFMVSYKSSVLKHFKTRLDVNESGISSSWAGSMHSYSMVERLATAKERETYKNCMISNGLCWDSKQCIPVQNEYISRVKVGEWYVIKPKNTLIDSQKTYAYEVMDIDIMKTGCPVKMKDQDNNDMILPIAELRSNDKWNFINVKRGNYLVIKDKDGNYITVVCGDNLKIENGDSYIIGSVCYNPDDREKLYMEKFKIEHSDDVRPAIYREIMEMNEAARDLGYTIDYGTLYHDCGTFEMGDVYTFKKDRTKFVGKIIGAKQKGLIIEPCYSYGTDDVDYVAFKTNYDIEPWTINDVNYSDVIELKDGDRTVMLMTGITYKPDNLTVHAKVGITHGKLKTDISCGVANLMIATKQQEEEFDRKIAEYGYGYKEGTFVSTVPGEIEELLGNYISQRLTASDVEYLAHSIYKIAKNCFVN